MWEAGAEERSGVPCTLEVRLDGQARMEPSEMLGRLHGGISVHLYWHLPYGEEKTRRNFPVPKGNNALSQPCHGCLTFLFLSFWLTGLNAINTSFTVLQGAEMGKNSEPSSMHQMTKHFFPWRLQYPHNLW